MVPPYIKTGCSYSAFQDSLEGHYLARLIRLQVGILEIEALSVIVPD